MKFVFPVRYKNTAAAFKYDIEYLKLEAETLEAAVAQVKPYMTRFAAVWGNSGTVDDFQNYIPFPYKHHSREEMDKMGLRNDESCSCHPISNA